MTPPETLTTGQKLQDALLDTLGDVIGEELAALDAEGFWALLRNRHHKVDITRFLANHHIPTRRPALADARRALPNLRRDRSPGREQALEWLCSGLRLDLIFALRAAVGLAPDDEHGEDGPQLGELIDKYGSPAIRLAALSQWGHPQTDSLVAMLIVDGRLVPSRWEAHLDRLKPISQQIVETLREARVTATTETTKLTDPEEPGAETTWQTERTAAEPPHEAIIGEDAQMVALRALQRWQEAAEAFETALEIVRREATGPLGRLTGLAPIGRIPSPELVERMKALAAATAADPEADATLQFLTDFVRLCDAARGGDETATLDADMAVRSHPAAGPYIPLIFSASRGNLSLPAVTPIDERLAPWMERSPVDLTGAPTTAELGDPVPDATGKPTMAVNIVSREPEIPQEVRSNKSGQIPPHTLEVESSAGEETLRASSVSEETATEGYASEQHSVGESQSAERAPLPAPNSVGEATVGSGLSAGDPTKPEPPASPPQAISTALPAGESKPAEGESVDVAAAYQARFDEVMSGLLAKRMWGLARWLFLGAEENSRAMALQAVAYADAARSATGPLATALPDLTTSLTPQALSGDRPIQLVALAAATRAALVAPYSGVAPILAALAPIFADVAPELAELAEAAHDSAIRGIVFGAEGAGMNEDDSSADTQVASLKREAAALLSRRGGTKAVRGDRIWRDWIQSGGLVHRLLEPVSEDRASAVGEVASLAAHLSKESEQNAQLKEADERNRGISPKGIDGSLRQILLARLREAVRIANQWAELRRSTQSRPMPEAVPHTAAVRQASRAAEAHLDEVLAGLVGSDGPTMEGACRGAEKIYHDTFRLVKGEGLPGRELHPVTLLDEDLLLTDVPLNENGQPTDLKSLTPAAIGTALERTWSEALEARAAMGDHRSTQAIISALSRTDPAGSATLGVRRGAMLAADRERIEGRTRDLRERLDAARRTGLLDETDAGDLENRMAIAGDEERLDIAKADVELDEIAETLDLLAEAATDEFRSRLAEAAREFPAVDAAMDRFEDLLRARDVATSEELLLQLKEGTPQPSTHQPQIDFRQFFPAVPESLPNGITESLIGCVASRAEWGPLDFTGLSADAATTRATALQAWLTVSKGERLARKAEALTPPLRLLGLEFKAERNPGLEGSNERSWIDLTGVTRVPQTLVPAFGSAAGSEQRVLLVWHQPNEALLDWVELDPSGRPVIVLYFGTMSPELRLRIGNRIRQRKYQPVVIVDDAVVAWAASLGQTSFEVTMRATLPFSAVNPYEPNIAGAVPIEMFYGRHAELREVVRDRGTCLLYGGRRLGKSALLRAAQRNFNVSAGHRAIYIDLANKGVGTSGRAESVWDLINVALIESGIAERPNSKKARPDPVQFATQAIDAWLDGGSARRMLLLLDECDDFFDLDAKSDFRQTRRLKDLMESSERRFKVVFAGLHQVARFASHPNQPLVHLGQPLAIGPLSPPAAHSLIAKPFTALGWRFESPDLIARALAYTNYTPILIQEFGKSLIDDLHAKTLDQGEPPSLITAEDIDRVLTSGTLNDAIRNRFHLTLSLDPRYKAIAYILAFRAGVGRRAGPGAAPITSRALLDECRDWWPAAFDPISSEEFRALLEELSGLGVLGRDRSGAWGIRSPNVLRLLGGHSEIEDRLIELVSEKPPTGGLVSSEVRRPLPGTDGRRSPFSEQVLADLIGDGRNQLRVVLGTDALGADMAAPALAAAQKVADRWELVRPTRPSVFARMVAEMTRKGHRVVFCDLRAAKPEAVCDAIAKASLIPSLRGATRSVVILAEPAMLPLVEEAIEGSGVLDAAIVALRRYTAAGLNMWALDSEAGFTGDEILRSVMDNTGGWPVLVDATEMRARSIGAHGALGSVKEELDTQPSPLLKQSGIASGPLREAYELIVEVLGSSGRETAEELGALLGDHFPDGESVVRSLVAAGALTEIEGRIGLEPVLYTCWSRQQARVPAPKSSS